MVPLHECAAAVQRLQPSRSGSSYAGWFSLIPHFSFQPKGKIIIKMEKKERKVI